jgi:hypothetical protein
MAAESFHKNWTESETNHQTTLNKYGTDSPNMVLNRNKLKTTFESFQRQFTVHQLALKNKIATGI